MCTAGALKRRMLEEGGIQVPAEATYQVCLGRSCFPGPLMAVISEQVGQEKSAAEHWGWTNSVSTVDRVCQEWLPPAPGHEEAEVKKKWYPPVSPSSENAQQISAPLAHALKLVSGSHSWATQALFELLPLCWTQSK